MEQRDFKCRRDCVEDVAAYDRGQDGCDSREEAAVERRGGKRWRKAAKFLAFKNVLKEG